MPFKGVTGSTILRILEKKLKIPFYLKSSASFNKLKNNAMIAVNIPKYGTSHCVVWDSDRKIIHDPYPDKSRPIKRKCSMQTYQNSIIYIIELPK